MNNIILCGFMGSGKSTGGKALAQKLGMRFFDSDEQIESAEHMKISDIFGAFGERYFRAAEAAVIKRLSSLDGVVIATGGGAVLDPENVRVLKQNGTIVFLDRAPENLIATDDRPLASRRSALEKLYAERYDIYTAAAELRIDANTTPEAEADAILKELGE